MASRKQPRTAPALRITMADGSSVVGSQASLAKILELTLFRTRRVPAREPLRLPVATRRAA
ncbi:MAG: hypothetical protein DWH79_06635 [Planctomycetota bacterium]|nr:MAG: hypothetical protein DWH79_06635 [Planctomycetota bacterium]